jgi:GDP-L-fucose synthase
MELILVTGSSGVAGSAFKKLAKIIKNKKFIFSTSSDCDLESKEKTKLYIEKIKPDYIINLAAISGGIGLSSKCQASLLYSNLAINFNILESCKSIKLKKLLLVLSSGIYPEHANLPLKESSLNSGEPFEAAYGYSYAKRILQPAIKAYRAQYGLKVIGAIPNGIFGENDNFNLDDAPMLPSVIRKCYEAKDVNIDIEIWGDGSPLREYTYSEDVAKSFLWMLENYDDDIALNTGTTEENSIKEIVFMILDELKIDKKRVYFNINKPSGILRKSTDNSIFKRLSNFQYTTFREGLRKTIKWFDYCYKNEKNELRIYSKNKH